MKIIHIEGIDIPVNIIKTKNKHTYFYFRKDGHIDVRKSRYQSDKDIERHIHKHKDLFLRKMKLNQQKHLDSTIYKLWGNAYTIIDNDTFMIDQSNRILYRNNSIDHDEKLDQYEKDAMLDELTKLVQRYQQHPLVDLEHVTFRVKPMKSRYGSCNKTKRRISMNQHLVHVDKQYLKYVFLHEITHLTHAHHQAEFYQMFEQLCPKYKELRQSIKTVW